MDAVKTGSSVVHSRRILTMSRSCTVLTVHRVKFSSHLAYRPFSVILLLNFRYWQKQLSLFTLLLLTALSNQLKLFFTSHYSYHIFLVDNSDRGSDIFVKTTVTFMSRQHLFTKARCEAYLTKDTVFGRNLLVQLPSNWKLMLLYGICN